MNAGPSHRPFRATTVATVIAALMLALLACPSAAAAQGPSLTALRSGVSRPTPADTATPRLVPSGATGRRIFGGIVGAYLGTFAGAALASAVLPRSQCGDDPGLCEAMLGAVVGGVVVSGLFAALPRGNGNCTYRRLAPRALMGATVGYLFGAVVSGDPFAATLLGGPVGAGLGAAFGANSCRAR